MGRWWKRSRNNIHDNATVDAKMKIMQEKFAKKIRKVVSKFEGFNSEKVLKILNKKPSKKTETLALTMKSDVQTKSDIAKTTYHESGIVLEKEENPRTEENDDKLETRIMEVEFKIPNLCHKYEVSIGKVISEFEGVKAYEVDIENQMVVVTGNFDHEKLLKKLREKMHKKKDEESKIAAEIKEEEIEITTRDMHARPDRDNYENQMAKYMMYSDANPNGCTIS